MCLSIPALLTRSSGRPSGPGVHKASINLDIAEVVIQDYFGRVNLCEYAHLSGSPKVDTRPIRKLSRIGEDREAISSLDRHTNGVPLTTCNHSQPPVRSSFHHLEHSCFTCWVRLTSIQGTMGSTYHTNFLARLLL